MWTYHPRFTPKSKKVVFQLPSHPFLVVNFQLPNFKVFSSAPNFQVSICNGRIFTFPPIYAVVGPRNSLHPPIHPSRPQKNPGVGTPGWKTRRRWPPWCKDTYLQQPPWRTTIWFEITVKLTFWLVRYLYAFMDEWMDGWIDMIGSCDRLIW